MNAEELLSENIVENINIDDDKQEKKHERLSSVVAGGNSKQYLGKELQLSDIDKMTPEQIDKLYCKYEARLGASMTKTLGNSFINLYVMGVSKYFKVVDPPKLIQDLKEDPFLNHGLTNICCELYYKYGMYLAPFTAMLTTARHIEPLASIDFKNKDENNDIKMMNENSKQEETGERSERAERDTLRSPSKEIFKNPNQKTQKE
ncbi:unnamed protein product [Mytilus coruscus]|uniref:Uncharacterized protein n=1 Tax=Mytilus coruscus TaxID=42192 RepID=A0A6J8BVA0_MYTCO|nr:unnamed protein product [Mytilus coruscus]